MAQATKPSPVWPSPTEATVGDKIIWISPEVPFELAWSTGQQTVNGHDTAWIQILRDQFQPIIFTHALIPDKFHALHSEFEPSLTAQQILVQSVVMTVVAGNAGISEEQYTLQLTCDDAGARIACTISSFQGGYYALQTLRQLFYKHSELEATALYTPYAPLEITDKPRFAHRGLNLDIARNRIGPDAVLRTIDGMASVKLNRLHLHATDSQSWPLEVPTLPELARKGAYHLSQIWTSDDLETVQKHGRLRGIEVFLEIGMPGHIASIHHSHPELIVGYDLRPWEPWAVEPPSGQLKLNSPQVGEFVKTLLADVLPRVAKLSSFFHVGTDEINTKIYELDAGVNSSDPDVIRPGLQELIDIVMTKILEAGLTPIAWEELLLDWDINLPKSTIIQVWRSHESLAKVMQKGHRAIFGPSTHWYLDGGHGSWVDPDPEKIEAQVKPPFLDWCSPYKNWRQICSYDPFENVPAEFHHLLYGGETSLWSELTDSVTLDSKIWPRAAAAAEVLWAGPGEINEQMTRRLAELRERLVLQGIGSAMVQMEWSLRNPGGSLM